MKGAAHHAIASKTWVFGLLDRTPMTPVRYAYGLVASGGTLLDGFSVISLGIAVPLIGHDRASASGFAAACAKVRATMGTFVARSCRPPGD